MWASSEMGLTSTQIAYTMTGALESICRYTLALPLLLTGLWSLLCNSTVLSPARTSAYRVVQVKNRKLHEQFEELAAAAGGATGGLFAGVNLFVNGFTIPSHLVC